MNYSFSYYIKGNFHIGTLMKNTGNIDCHRCLLLFNGGISLSFGEILRASLLKIHTYIVQQILLNAYWKPGLVLGT